jgi:hypothetical protein
MEYVDVRERRSESEKGEVVVVEWGLSRES